MTHVFLMSGQEKEGRQIVRRPRATDVVGQALRSAFDNTPGVPDDMATLLRRLDCMGTA